jgi:hypothetical protein
VSKVSNKCGNLGERPDWLADDAVRYEPVSPCKFGKCREILTKCRDAVSVARLKTVKSQQLGWGSPYFNSREAILLEQGSETSAARPVKRSREFFK